MTFAFRNNFKDDYIEGFRMIDHVATATGLDAGTAGKAVGLFLPVLLRPPRKAKRSAFRVLASSRSKHPSRRSAA